MRLRLSFRYNDYLRMKAIYSNDKYKVKANKHGIGEMTGDTTTIWHGA